LDPQYSAALYQLGRAYHFDMNLAAAGPLLERIPPGAPEYLEARFTLGLNYYYLADYVKAAAVFMALPPTYDDLINLGAALAARGDAAGAQAAWRRAANRDPLRTESFFNLAWIAFNRGDLDGASRSLEQFFRLQGRDAEALFLQGRVYERQGRNDDSQKAISQAIRLSPRIERWVNQPLPSLQRLRIQADTTELRTALQPSTWTPNRLSRRALGQDVTAWLESAQTQMESQLYGDALRELQDVIRVFPQSADARLVRGQVYERQKRTDLAINEYQESIYLKPSADAFVLIAKVYRAMNQSGPALDAVGEALKLEPGNYVAAGLKAELERAAARPRQ
jgi:tetratricopeptide (TPR) repeat protein